MKYKVDDILLVYANEIREFPKGALVQVVERDFANELYLVTPLTKDNGRTFISQNEHLKEILDNSTHAGYSSYSDNDLEEIKRQAGNFAPVDIGITAWVSENNCRKVNLLPNKLQKLLAKILKL